MSHNIAKLAATGFSVDTDANFKDTVLLLHGDGTNGAQNNTFTDSSTNAFTITRNGNTTQGTFSPFSQADGYWGNYFDGSGDYFKTSTTQIIPAGNFTLECWVYPSTTSDMIFVSQGASGNSGRFYLGIISGNWTLNLGSSAVGTVAAVANTWTYLAVTFNGSTYTLYANGSSAGTISSSTNVGNYAIYVGSVDQAWIAGFDTNGYISNVRVSTTVRTISTPTAPYSSDANTKFLTCQSNRFVDNSTNAYALTIGGTPSVQSFSPFAPTAAWSASTNGGSGYFDGSGDYLSVPDNAAWDVGTADFTIEFWWYPTELPTTGTLFGQWTGTKSTSSFAIRYASSTLTAALYVGTGDYDVSSSDIQVNAWNHIAFVRGNAGALDRVALFINGNRVGTNGLLTSDSGNSSSAVLTIASKDDGTENVKGYFSGIRFVNGTEIYDVEQTTYTIPTAPPTAVTNTQLLTNFTNAGIYDSTAKNDLETVGNAQISTAQSKFGGSSMYFDGTGDYLTSCYNPWLRLANADFTIEFWMRLAASQANMGIVSSYESDNGWLVRLDTTYIRFYAASTAIDRTYSFSTNTWYHIAITRYGTSLRIFVDGTQIGATETVGTFTDTTTAGLQIGRTQTISNDFNGYIDDLRITKGVARYTANFTAPTKAFADQ